MPIRVLIAEDDKITRELMLRWLASFQDAEFSITSKLSEVLDAIRGANPPDIILLDLTLEDSGSIKTAAAIAEMSQHSTVLVITGNPDPPKLDVASLIKDGKFFTSLPAAIARALLSRPNGQWAKAEDSLERMKKLASPIDAPE